MDASEQRCVADIHWFCRAGRCAADDAASTGGDAHATTTATQLERTAIRGVRRRQHDADEFRRARRGALPHDRTGPSPGLCRNPVWVFRRRSSFTFGGFVGYNIQFGAMVAGVEGDIAWKRGSISGTLGTTTPGLAGPLVGPPPGVASIYTRTEGFSGSLTQGADGSARARFGMLVTPH